MFITLASTKIMFFIAVAHVLSLLWQLIMRKMKVGLYCYLTAGTLLVVLIHFKFSLTKNNPFSDFFLKFYPFKAMSHFLSFQRIN